MTSHITQHNLSGIVIRGGLLLFFWWALSDGAISSWWIGLPAVLIALLVSLRLLPPVNIAWLQWLKFVPFFIWLSLRGGIDVAWRAFHPRLPIDPQIIEYPLQLPPGLARVFMASTINLLPGTLSATLDHNSMQVHILDSQQDVIAELQAVEQQVARMFGISLKALHEVN